MAPPSPYPGFHLSRLDFALDDLASLPAYQLALVWVHPLATAQDRERAELYFGRQREQAKAAGHKIGENERKQLEMLGLAEVEQPTKDPRIRIKPEPVEETVHSATAAARPPTPPLPSRSPPPPRRGQDPSPPSPPQRTAVPLSPQQHRPVQEEQPFSPRYPPLAPAEPTSARLGVAPFSASASQLPALFNGPIHYRPLQQSRLPPPPHQQSSLLPSAIIRQQSPPRHQSPPQHQHHQPPPPPPPPPDRNPYQHELISLWPNPHYIALSPPPQPHLAEGFIPTFPPSCSSHQPLPPPTDPIDPAFLKSLHFVHYTVPSLYITSTLLRHFLLRPQREHGPMPIVLAPSSEEAHGAGWWVGYRTPEEAREARDRNNRKVLPSLYLNPESDATLTAEIRRPKREVQEEWRWEMVWPPAQRDWLAFGLVTMFVGAGPPLVRDEVIGEKYQEEVKVVKEAVREARIAAGKRKAEAKRRAAQAEEGKGQLGRRKKGKAKAKGEAAAARQRTKKQINVATRMVPLEGQPAPRPPSREAPELEEGEEWEPDRAEEEEEDAEEEAGTPPLPQEEEAGTPPLPSPPPPTSRALVDYNTVPSPPPGPVPRGAVFRAALRDVATTRPREPEAEPALPASEPARTTEAIFRAAVQDSARPPQPRPPAVVTPPTRSPTPPPPAAQAIAETEAEATAAFRDAVRRAVHASVTPAPSSPPPSAALAAPPSPAPFTLPPPSASYSQRSRLDIPPIPSLKLDGNAKPKQRNFNPAHFPFAFPGLSSAPTKRRRREKVAPPAEGEGTDVEKRIKLT